MINYYGVLGIPENADPARVETAYRSGVQLWTPENRREQAIRVAAYVALINPQLREAHDDGLGKQPGTTIIKIDGVTMTLKQFEDLFGWDKETPPNINVQA